MVVINKYSSTQINGLSSTTARVVYDNTLNALRFNNATNYANVIVAKDLSNNLSGINNVNTTGSLGVNSSSPDRQLEINSSTGSCLRLSYNASSGSATNYADMTVSSSGNLTINPSGGIVNLSSHNGSTTGLQLGGTLVTATANEINYLDITATGIAEASKALVLDSSRNLINVNYFECGDLAVVKQAPTDSSVSIALSLISTPETEAAAGIGSGIEFDMVNDSSSVFAGGYLNCVTSDVVADTENAYFEFKLINDGTMNTVSTLSPTGVFTATTLAETSDRRLKENIKDIDPTDSLDKILEVKVKEYNYTFEKDKRHTGVIAQEIKQYIPEVVNISNSHGLEDFHSVHYSGLVPHLINCIKQLKKEIDDLKSRD